MTTAALPVQTPMQQVLRTGLSHPRGNPDAARGVRKVMGGTSWGVTWPAMPTYASKDTNLWSRKWACLDWAKSISAVHVPGVDYTHRFHWLLTGRKTEGALDAHRMPVWLDHASCWVTPQGRLLVVQPYERLDQAFTRELSRTATECHLSVLAGGTGWYGLDTLWIEMRPAGPTEGLSMI